MTIVKPLQLGRLPILAQGHQIFLWAYSDLCNDYNERRQYELPGDGLLCIVCRRNPAEHYGRGNDNICDRCHHTSLEHIGKPVGWAEERRLTRLYNDLVACGYRLIRPNANEGPPICDSQFKLRAFRLYEGICEHYLPPDQDPHRPCETCRFAGYAHDAPAVPLAIRIKLQRGYAALWEAGYEFVKRDPAPAS